MNLIQIEKPRYGKPCNGCGLCCDVPCPPIAILFPNEHPNNGVTLCPRLRVVDGQNVCGLILDETGERKEWVSLTLGVGVGCDAVMTRADDYQRYKRPLRREKGDHKRVHELISILGLRKRVDRYYEGN